VRAGGGFETLRSFRQSINAGIDYTLLLLEGMLIDPGQVLTEAKVYAEGIAGIPATGRPVRTLDLFKDSKMALRWDRSDLAAAMQSLAAAGG
jgi:hypothetical protein